MGNKSQFELMMDAAAKNRDLIKALKNVFVRQKEYELAAFWRDTERKLFPMPEDSKEQINLAEKLSTVFRMSGLTVSEEHSWIIYQNVKSFIEKGEQFSLDDAAGIESKAKLIFG